MAQEPLVETIVVGGVQYPVVWIAGQGSPSAAGVASPQANGATYTAYGSGYAGYATPTDLITLSGSATKTVAITNMLIGIQSTAAALQTIAWIKRGAANTGGTAATPAAVPHDSAQPAATAVLRLYSVIPSALGAAVGTLHTVIASSAVLTAAPTNFSYYPIPYAYQAMASTFQAPIVLRGVAESLCINYGGAALTAGFVASYLVEWIEF